MILLTFQIQVPAGLQAEYEQKFATWRQQILDEEPDTLRYDLYRQPDDDTRYMVLQMFTGQAALDLHAANMYARGIPQSSAHLAQVPPTMIFYQPVLVSANAFERQP